MDAQLTSNEINLAREILHDYDPAQHALNNLEKHNGNLERSFEDLWTETNGPPPTMRDNKSLWQITLKALRKELCGDDGFRGQLSDYTKNPGSAPLLSGLIVSLVGIAGGHGLPLDPAIATIVVLYVVKIGLNIFMRLYRTTSGCYLIDIGMEKNVETLHLRSLQGFQITHK